MEFTMKKPPIISNQQRSYKRSLSLHISLIIVSLTAIFTRAFIAVPEGESWVPDQMFKTFLMLFTGALVSVLIELVYSITEGTSQEFSEYRRLVDPINTGLLIALLLPTSTPMYVLILAVAVGVYVGKIVFGGYGYYIFNPALVGVLFATISFATQIEYGDTPLVLLKQAIEGQSYTFELIDLVLGNYVAVAIGSTSVIVLGGVFIYLSITRVIDLRLSGTFVLAILVISAIVGFVNFGGAMWNYVFVNMITGLTMFGAVFLVAETVSSPTSREAKLIYAVVIAIMTMMVRILGTEVEGVVFAVLLGNMLAPFLNRTVTRSNKKLFIQTSVILAVVVIVTGFVLGFILQGRLIEAFDAMIQWGGMIA